MIFSSYRSKLAFRPGGRTLLARIPLLAIGILGGGLSVRAAEQKTDVTLSEFRALVQEQSPLEKLQANLDRAGEVFSRLLAAQGREAAARQSLDRLSGWHKAAQARLQAQNAPASDVDLLRFSEARATASVAQFEAERREAMQEANLLLKRPPDTALLALMEGSGGRDTPDAAKGADQSRDREGAVSSRGANEPGPSPSPVPPIPTATAQEVGPEIASHKAQFEKELLPLGAELLSKMYQSYLFGGIPLTALLWQEQQVYNTELQYRLLLVEAERKGTGNRE